MHPKNWWMFHGDRHHTGEVLDSPIDSCTVAKLVKKSIDVPGSILSTPAVVDGYIYVGLANATASKDVPTGIGGSMLKVNIETGAIEHTFNWTIDVNDRDSHGFSGMGCTPAVVDGKVYFMAFNGVLYCLNADDMTLEWSTNLRWADPAKNQPVNNVANYGQEAPTPQAAGWSSPCVHGGKVWVGIGEGENDALYSFVYCLDAATGNVIWIFCTNKFDKHAHNEPNVLPESMVITPLAPPFTSTKATPLSLGCSVWSSPAYDADLDILYCTTGNPSPDGWLPSEGYAVSLLALRGSTGHYVGHQQFPPESSYRPSDQDVDIGGAVTLYTIDGRKVAGVGCKNGSYMLCDAETIELIRWRQMLPKKNDGSLIASVDPHGPDTSTELDPHISNEQSNQRVQNPPSDYSGENFHGTYSTAALCSAQKKLFIGLGGNNYHWIAPGIDSDNTPFMRAMDWETLDDAWPMAGDPLKYTTAAAAMYKTNGESGISVPAVVNDVVFMATTGVAIYAFSVEDGTLLWQDVIGAQTGGFNGGYGYCMGPAIWRDYVVAGALVADHPGGGVLNIYRLGS